MSTRTRRGTVEKSLEVENEAFDYSTQLVGEIAAIDDDGSARVVFPGNVAVPERARCVASLRLRESVEQLIGAPVLLVFEGADPGKPIILGLLRDSLIEGGTELAFDLGAGTNEDADVNGRKISFNADREIVLKCGKSSIHLRRDGKLLIRGERILSRARVTNRIKGGSVNIN